MVDGEFKRRSVAVEKLIRSISRDDSRVKVVGAVIEKDSENGIFVIDDGNDKLTVILQSPELIDKVVVGRFVRVVGLVVPFEEGFELRGELVQDFSDLNKGLFEQYCSIQKL